MPHLMHRSALPLLLLACLGCSGPESQGAAPEAGDATGSSAASASGLYALGARSLEGEDRPLIEFAGRVTLVVNVASKCGLTPQYEGLQALHTSLAEQGFSVLAFPSNEFGGQEPGSPEQIREFCSANYGVSFPMFEKCATQSGDGQSPIYTYLVSKTSSIPSWNFGKYLVGKDGETVQYFGSRTSPEDPQLLAAIEAALAAPDDA